MTCKVVINTSLQWVGRINGQYPHPTVLVSDPGILPYTTSTLYYTTHSDTMLHCVQLCTRNPIRTCKCKQFTHKHIHTTHTLTHPFTHTSTYIPHTHLHAHTPINSSPYLTLTMQISFKQHTALANSSSSGLNPFTACFRYVATACLTSWSVAVKKHQNG